MITTLAVREYLNPEDFKKTQTTTGKVPKSYIRVGTKIVISQQLCKEADLKEGDKINIVLLNSNRYGFIKSPIAHNPVFNLSKVSKGCIGISNKKLCNHILTHYKLHTSLEKGIIKSHSFDIEKEVFGTGANIFILLPPKEYEE